MENNTALWKNYKKIDKMKKGFFYGDNNNPDVVHQVIGSPAASSGLQMLHSGSKHHQK